MKKFWLSLLCIVLAASMVLTGFACKRKDPESSQPESEPTSQEDSEAEPNTEPWVVDPVDATGNWIGTNPSLQTTDAKYGSAWLLSSTRDDQGSAVFSRTFDETIDLRGYANGYLHMYVYIENVSYLTGGQVELSSAGTPDTRELSWDLGLYVTKSGWNELNLPLEAGNLVGGEIDLKKVDFMRVFLILTEDTDTGIDMIEFTNVEPEEQSRIDASGNFVFDEIEVKGIWDGSNPRLITENAPVENAYLYCDEVMDDVLVLCRTFDDFNINGFTNGYVRLWIYIKDIAKVTGGQIELSSAGTCDVDEISWSLLNYVTKSGWNEVYLPLSKGVLEGDPDFTSLNYARVFALTTEPNGLGLDYFCLTNTAPVEPSRIDKNNQFILDAVNGLETWDGTAVKIGTNGRSKGDNYIYTQTRNPGDNAMVLSRTFTGLDAKAYKNGYLHLYIYVQDASAITGGQIELSSDTADSEETSWGLSAFTLKNGWNNIYLSLKEADKVGGNTDFSNLTYFRMYLFSSKNQKIGLDYICLSLKAPAKESPIDVNGNYVIDNISAVAPWNGDTTLVYNTTNGFTDGAGWISTSTSSARDLVITRNYAEADLSSYKYLHIWVYVNDLSALTGGMIEITSAGIPDEEELYWPIASYLKQNGWNELFLPIADAMTQGKTPADLTKMDYIRFVAMVNAKGANVGIDMVYATNAEPQKEQDEELDTITIDKCENLDKWAGTGLTLVSNSAPEGTAFIKTGSDACPVAYAGIVPSINMAHLATEGYLHLNLYVEDPDNVSYGQIELTSSSNCDQNEVSWNVRELGLKSGWNELYLPFNGANHEGGDPNFEAINYCRLYVGFTEASYFAFDDMYITKTAPATRIVIHSMDNATGFAGDSLTVETVNAFEGTGYVKSGSAACPVICSAITPVDISELSNGYVHVYLYVSSTDIAYGQIELTSGGAADTNEISWDVTTLNLKTGWNELYLSINDADEVGGTIDFTAINYFRVYVGYTAEGNIALDDLSVVKTKGGDTIAYALAVQEARERSILNRGSVNMRAAIKKVLDKLENGEPVVASVFGPSTAAGAGASYGKGYADLFFNYLEALDGDSANNNLTRVNYSIGSTEGVYSVTRADKDLLAYHPEFVVVNISRNDANLPYPVEAYEGEFTKLFNAGIPFVVLTTCGEDGLTMEKDCIDLCKQYGVPMISFPTAYVEFAHATEIAGLTNEEVWSGDHVHPSNTGHALIADLLTSFLDSLTDVTAADFDNTLPEKVTRNGFFDSKLIENFNAAAQGMTVTMNGWTADYAARIYQLSNEGWQTSTIGSSISFTFTGGYFYFMFALSNNSGNLQINVDGVDTELITWAQQNGETYMNVYHVLHNLTSGEHTVKLTLVDCDRTENDWFGICSVGYSNTAGTTEPSNVEFGVIDHVDANSSWGDGITYINTDSYETDGYWAKGTAAGTTDVVFYKSFADMDVNDYVNGFLHMWVYVSDIAKLRTYGGMIEISSANTVDNQELFWDISSVVKKSGWNELYLSMKSAQKQGDTNFNPDKLNTMRVVFMFQEAGDCGISEVYFVEEKPFVSKIVINEFADGTGAWGDNFEYKNGAAFAKSSNNGITDPVNYTGALVWKTNDAIDISGMADGYIHASVYIEDAADLFYDWGRIKIGSGEAATTTNIELKLVNTALTDGWNDLYFKISDAAANTADLTQISWIWAYIYSWSQNKAFGLKNVYVVPAIPAERISLNSMDSSLGMWGTGFEVVESADAKEGTAYAKAISTDLTAPSICWKGAGIDISDLSGNGYVHMWFYTADASKVLGTSQVNIGDGINYYKWNISSSMLNNGWTELFLPLADASVVACGTLAPVADGTVDDTNISDVWIFTYFSEANVEYRIDDLSVVRDCPKDTSIIRFTGLDSQSALIWGDGLSFQTGNDAIGTGYIQATVATDGGSAAICYANSAYPIDITPLTNGYLHIRVYVADHTKVAVGSAMNIGDGSVNYNWPITSDMLQDGWTDLYLAIADATGTPNVKAMTNLWFYLYMTEAGSTFGLDDVYFCAENPEPTEPAEPVTRIDVNSFATNSGIWGDGMSFADSAAFATTVNDGIADPKNYTGAICWQIYSDFVDATPLADGYLHFCFYIDDVDNMFFDWSRFKIGSGSCCATTNLEYAINKEQCTDGWNEFYIKVSDITDNGADLTQLAWIWCYAYSYSNETVFGLKDVYFCAEKPEAPIPTVTRVDVNSFAVNSGLWGDGFFFDGAPFAKAANGTGAYTGGLCWKIYDNFVDASAITEGYLHVSVYVEDPSELQYDWSHFLIGNGDHGSATKLEWALTNADLTAGWNDVYFPIESAIANAADMTQLSWIWFYTYTRSQNAVWGMKDVYFTTEKPAGEHVNICMFEASDAAVTYGDAYSLNTTNTRQGASFGLAHNGAAGTSGAVVYDNGSNKVDITGKAYIHVSFFIEDPSNVLYDWGSFQLGDGTTALTWAMTADMFKAGWNDVYLPIASAAGSTDLTKISKIWFYLYCRDANVGFGIDNVYATNVAPTTATVLLHNCDANGTVWGAGYELGTSGTYRGTGFFKCVLSLADVYTGSICTNNVVDATNATKLHLAVYLNDPSKLDINAVFQMGDGTNNIFWSFDIAQLKAGWNEIVLDLSSGTKTGGDVNMAAIGNIFFYMNSNIEGCIFGLDDVYFIK